MTVAGLEDIVLKEMKAFNSNFKSDAFTRRENFVICAEDLSVRQWNFLSGYRYHVSLQNMASHVACLTALPSIQPS